MKSCIEHDLSAIRDIVDGIWPTCEALGLIIHTGDGWIIYTTEEDRDKIASVLLDFRNSEGESE